MAYRVSVPASIMQTHVCAVVNYGPARRLAGFGPAATPAVNQKDLHARAARVTFVLKVILEKAAVLHGGIGGQRSL